VRLLFCLLNLSFLKASALVFSEFYWGSLLGYGWMVFFFVFLTIFRNLFGLFFSELVKYFHIERFLAAKFGTISVVFMVW
jgi:hypothetical protein